MLIRKSKYFSKYVTFASIDIGINNMGIVWGKCDIKYKKIKFYKLQHLDLKKIIIKHKSGKQGYNHIVDKLKHVWGTNIKESPFNMCDHIFVEYQPPTGLRIIQEYLVLFFNEKIIFIHPKSMHKYYNINKFTYEKRKEFTEYKSIRYMTFNFYNEWKLLSRKHDCSDAIILAVYFIKVNS
jgi:hypothetical protein